MYHREYKCTYMRVWNFYCRIILHILFVISCVFDFLLQQLIDSYFVFPGLRNSISRIYTVGTTPVYVIKDENTPIQISDVWTTLEFKFQELFTYILARATRVANTSCSRRCTGVFCSRRYAGVFCSRRYAGVFCSRRCAGVFWN